MCKVCTSITNRSTRAKFSIIIWIPLERGRGGGMEGEKEREIEGKKKRKRERQRERERERERERCSYFWGSFVHFSM